MDRSLFILLCKKWMVTTFKHSKMHAHNTEYDQKWCTAQWRIQPTKRITNNYKALYSYCANASSHVICWDIHTPPMLAYIWITVKMWKLNALSAHGFMRCNNNQKLSFISWSMFMGFVSENKCQVVMTVLDSVIKRTYSEFLKKKNTPQAK